MSSRLKKAGVEIKQALSSTFNIIVAGVKLIISNPSILVYPKLASWIIPPLTGVLFALTYWLINNPLNVSQHVVKTLIATGLLGYIYAGFLSSYFTCAIVSTALSELDGIKELPLLGQLRRIRKRFWRITRFGLAAIALPVISIYARRKELSWKNALFVIAGSFTLNIAFLAPGIMEREGTISATIRSSAATLGKAWRQGLLIKAFMYLSLLIVASIGFLPKLVQDLWFDGSSARAIGWILSAILWLVSFVMIRIISSIFNAVLYHKAVNNQL